VGEILARLLKTCGYSVDTEYYVNICGKQMRILGDALLYRYRELFGEENVVSRDEYYPGEYITVLALTVAKEQELVKQLADFPDMLAEDADAFEPHRATFYLIAVYRIFALPFHFFLPCFSAFRGLFRVFPCPSGDGRSTKGTSKSSSKAVRILCKRVHQLYG